MSATPLVYPYGAAVISAQLKSIPADFQVSETLGFEPSGQGEHLFLLVEKNALSTVELVTRIARDFAIHPRLIGYSGLKDKQAITRQWMSLHLPGRTVDLSRRQGDGYCILRHARHRNKLRRGSHRSNFFRVRLRAVSDFPDDSKAQLEALEKCGMANYFGRQRFGRRQDNVAQALQQLTRGGLKFTRKSLLLSALRSHLFNQVLSRRITRGYWQQQALNGDVFMLRGSRSIFSDSVDERLMQRLDSMDISPTASLYGLGINRLQGIAREIEQQVCDENPDITALLEQQGLKRQMRTLRVAVDEFSVEFDASRRVLDLTAGLPAGSYMTSLLDHFVDAVDAD